MPLAFVFQAVIMMLEELRSGGNKNEPDGYDKDSRDVVGF